MTRRLPPRNAGFSLIEVLVALLILALASAALIDIGQRHVAAYDMLETRQFAGLVAENAVTDLRLGTSPVIAGESSVELAARDWIVSVQNVSPAGADLAEVEVAVREAGRPGTVVTLTAFVDTGKQS